MNEIAKRLAAHPRWRWMPGMAGRFAKHRWRLGSDGDPMPRGWWPDLDDPATKGCLLAMLRECSGDPTAECVVFAPLARDPIRWVCRWFEDEGHCAVSADAATEGEALAACLLKMWGEPGT